MVWAQVIAWFAGSGVATYILYLLFLFAVLIKYGPDGVEKVAKVVPPPRWVEAVAKAITSAKKSTKKPSAPD